MIYTEMRSERSRRGRASAALAAGLLLLAGCSGSQPAVESAASPAPREITTDTVVEATSPPTPTPNPAPSTTDEATPAIPDPSDIDVAYMQEVADVFAHREGQIVRTAVTEGRYTKKLDSLIKESAGGVYLQLSTAEWQQLLADGSYLERYEENPSAPVWDVRSVDTTAFPCVSVLTSVDVSPTRAGGPYEPRPTLLAFRVRESASTFSAWTLDRVAVGEGLEEYNACTAE